jgi:hypothetical protein
MTWSDQQDQEVHALHQQHMQLLHRVFSHVLGLALACTTVAVHCY